MTETASTPRATIRLALLVELGLFVRVLAADAATWAAARRGVRWLFPDTDLYWRLGEAIRLGAPYEVSQWGVPHFALRAPGYPLFLAACQGLFGDRTLPARLVQAALGASCIWVVYRLVRRVVNGAPEPDTSSQFGGERADPGSTPSRCSLGTPALIAAALVAVEPYTVATSAVLLSEALFLPLMLLGLWGLSVIWSPSAEQGRAQGYFLKAVATGVAWGAAVLTKPSWALFPPLALGAWVAFAGVGWRPRGRALAGSLAVVLGLSAIMAPWWVRNERVFGRFVPTALWSGASLYDGLNPRATGASDMSFLNEPEVRALHEEAQDAILSARALAFARGIPFGCSNWRRSRRRGTGPPGRTSKRSRSPWVALASALVVVPLYVLAIVGAWDRRRDPRALMILAAPVLYFAAIHMVFVSSIRYRIPGFVPALGLVAIGLKKTHAKSQSRKGRPE